MDALMMNPGSDVSAIDKGIRNKWRWAWVEGLDEAGQTFEWCKKIKIAGACFCVICQNRLMYGSNGKKVLRSHASDPNHKAKVRAQKLTSTLPGAAPRLAPPSMADRVCEQKVRVCSFLAEHDISFTIAQPLVSLAKKLAEDKTALSRLTLSNSQASYVITNGIAPQLKRQLSEKLHNAFFSLNADESTNQNNDRLLNILVRFYDDECGSVVTQHLASKKVNIADATGLLKALSAVLQEFSLNWNQVVSVLFDNCAVMRGKKTGVETQVRKQNPALLDICGDTVHMVSNASKQFLEPFKGMLEDVCSDIFYDIEKSPKQREIFKEFQGLLHVHSQKGYFSLKRPISSRFLQMLEVANRIKELLDVLLVHFYCYLSKEDQLKHRHMINRVLEQHSVTDAERARLRQLQQQQGSCRLQTDAASNRKRRITRVLFDDFDRLTVLLDLYRGLLPTFQSFLKNVQHEKPLVHVLHAEMVVLVRAFLSLFMKPQHIPISVKELKKVDVTDPSLQRSDKGLSVGPHSFESMSKARLHNQHWVEEVYTSLREGYVKAGKYLLEKLPLENSTITNLATLSPTMISHEATRQGLLSLGRSLPNVLDTAKLGQLDAEVRAYQVDVDLLNLQREYPTDARIDVDWWRKVFLLKTQTGERRYPVMQKLVKALLSIFTGPLVEGSFNLMDDILEADRTSMNVETYESLAFIKSHLKAERKTASTVAISSSMRRSCLSSYQTYQTRLQEKTAREEEQRNKRLEAAVEVESSGKKGQMDNPKASGVWNFLKRKPDSALKGFTIPKKKKI